MHPAAGELRLPTAGLPCPPEPACSTRVFYTRIRGTHPMSDIVIAGALRTAIGKFGGALAKVAAPDLGATVVRALLAQSGIKPDQVSEVILGQVLAAGSGQNPARQTL